MVGSGEGAERLERKSLEGVVRRILVFAFAFASDG